ncbi:hypothetical protein Glove_21g310 [Diversispora epigaea]|uniref:Uncharacterized protein n=1 Tax=Diversispora epigaea TaxID=1348612 RepID=A0A397JM42_9GLOM|nr:hypothetical protein Glove_21g310 [Diversispora epigaea]
MVSPTVPELQKSLAPKFRPSVTQLTKWLNSIHKSRRATARMRNSGKLPKDLRRVHANNRQNDKKLRRIKAAKELFRKNNPNVTDYNKESLLRMLTDRAFHSPKMSDTDEEDRSKTVVNVYDLSWRSAELKHLLRNVLDPKSASSTTAQLQRKRNYSDEIQRYDFPPPAKAPNWACNEQEDVLKHLLRNVLDPKSASSTTTQLQRKRNYSDEIQRYDFPPPAKAPNWACNEQEDVVYDTEFLKHLLRNVLDPKSASSTTTQLQRKRNYSDEIQRYDFPPPAKAPNWACNEQEDVVYDTEFVQTEGEDEPSFANTSSSKISAEQE